MLSADTCSPVTVTARLSAALASAVTVPLTLTRGTAEAGDPNPCDRLGPVLGPQQARTQHMRALPHREVAAAVAAVRGSRAMPALKLAFEFLVLTAGRCGPRWT